MKKIFSLKNIDVTLGNHKALDNIDWQVYSSESWAILGGNGSGKSTLLRLVLGEIWPDQLKPNDPSSLERELNWYIAGKKEISPIAVKKVVAAVSPELQSWYTEHGWHLSGEELLLSGLYGSPLLYSPPFAEEVSEIEALANELELEHLLDRSVAAMSQGQLRSMLVARALAAKPAILALDEVFDGLDTYSREIMMNIFAHMDVDETTILITAHRKEDLPPFISHGLILENGRITDKGSLSEIKHPLLNQDNTTQALPSLSAPPVCIATPPILELKNIDVFVNRNHVLHDINWTLEKGQNWAVLGENGSGKSTLLRCIWGDEHYAYGGEMSWFGKSGPVDLAILHKEIGLISDRLQSEIPPELLAEDIVVSGFFSSIDLYEKPTTEQRDQAFELMRDMQLINSCGKQAKTLSYGQLRRILLARALVHKPKLLLLDEPCSGLDNASRNAFLINLSSAVHKGLTQIIHVTHRTDDLAGLTTHALHLDKGHITYCGTYPKPV